MADNIPVTNGQGQSSVAAEEIGSLKYQKIKIVGGESGSTSVWGITPDGSGKVSVIGTVAVTPSGAGSIVAVLKSSSLIGVVTGSVVAIPTGNQSVSGTVDASVLGWVPIQASNTSVIGVIQGSVAVAIISGSIAASVTPPANQSVSGNVGASILGWVPIQPSNTSVITVAQGSVAVTIVSGSIAATFTPPANQSVSGTAGASIIGWVPIQPSNTSTIGIFQNSSILAVPVGSVITVWKDSSILAVPTSSQIGIWQSPSIVGTYAEDAAATTGDKGLFVFGVRNDTLSSMTSADLDYSSHVVGPAGEIVTANAPLTKWVQGVADFRQGNAGASIIVITGGGTSVFTYITAVQLANMGSASVLVTLASGGSTLGYTIAPAGGGSNIYYPNGLKTPASFGFAASTSGIASVLVSAQGFISKT